MKAVKLACFANSLLKMNRGLTWSSAEVKCLIDIWSDEHIAEQLCKTHKNTEIYKVFSERLQDMGYNRSIEQCRAKAKKLRQQYIKVRDSLRKTGSSGDEKDKFTWFDELDKILGTNPVVDPVDVVESNEPDNCDPALSSANISSQAEGSNDHGDDGAVFLDEEMSDAAQSTDSSFEETTQRLPIPGAQSRKRKHKSSYLDQKFLSYMAENRRQLEALNKAEEQHLAQETAIFEKMLKAQQEAEESRFRRMQEQQQANYQMLLQVMGSFVNALHQEQPNSTLSHPTIPPTTSGSWPISVPTTKPISSVQCPVMPMPQHEHMSQPSLIENTQPCVSSTLHCVNSAQNYYNL